MSDFKIEVGKIYIWQEKVLYQPFEGRVLKIDKGKKLYFVRPTMIGPSDWRLWQDRFGRNGEWLGKKNFIGKSKFF